jgi:hypothetical protein
MPFAGSPLRSIAGAFDAVALEESKASHRTCIEWLIENASTTLMLKLDAEGFDRWILEPSRTWMNADFNIDVFGATWVELFPELSDHFDAEKHHSAAHLAAVAAAAATAVTAAEAGMDNVELRRTKKLKQKATKKARRAKAKAEAKARASAEASGSASDDEAELRVTTNPVEFTPKKSLERSFDELDDVDTTGTYPGELAIKLARQESKQAADEAAAELNPIARRKLILVSL